MYCSEINIRTSFVLVPELQLSETLPHELFLKVPAFASPVRTPMIQLVIKWQQRLATNIEALYAHAYICIYWGGFKFFLFRCGVHLALPPLLHEFTNVFPRLACEKEDSLPKG
jgi:hypothetical protein